MVETRLVSVNTLKPGSFVMIDGRPCKIIDIITSSTGKHGAAKARIIGIDLIDGRRRETVRGTDDKIEAPVIEKKNGQIVFIESKEKVQVMDLETYETFEADVDEEVRDKIFEGAEVEYWIIPYEKGVYRVVKRVRT